MKLKVVGNKIIIECINPVIKRELVDFGDKF
jgi:hypothetical protein